MDKNKNTQQGAPLVSIRCLVYNHEPFLRQCLDGFVMQQTTFPFEAIVHDDASTDGSAAIIREYAEKYPDIIKPIYETENQYSKHDGSIRRAIEAVMHPASKYIAVCEGDDYWTDPNKLQIPVDFLEAHPDHSFSVHEYKEWDELNACYRPHQLRFLRNTDEDLTLTINDFATGVFFTKSLTCVYNRKALHNSNFKMYDTKFDMTMFYALMTQGKCRLFNRVMGCYRIQPNSVTSPKNLGQFRHLTNDAMFSLCREEKTEQSREFVFNYLKPFALSVILNHQWSTIKNYYKYLGMRRALVISVVEPVRMVWKIATKKISQ
jgi:glycosyltransferase involved in cell wall biosynthesis